MKENENIKERIRTKGLNKIEKYFDLDMEKLANLHPDVLNHLYKMARLGMQFEKEMNINKRAIDSTYLRIARMISENKEEMKQYLNKTLKEYM